VLPVAIPQQRQGAQQKHKIEIQQGMLGDEINHGSEDQKHGQNTNRSQKTPSRVGDV
jgi:hypothetical protein